MSKQPPPVTTASAVGPCPTIIQISTMHRHRKLPSSIRITRSAPSPECKPLKLKNVKNRLVGGIQLNEMTAVWEKHCVSLELCLMYSTDLRLSLLYTKMYDVEFHRKRLTGTGLEVQVAKI